MQLKKFRNKCTGGVDETLYCLKLVKKCLAASHPRNSELLFMLRRVT